MKVYMRSLGVDNKFIMGEHVLGRRTADFGLAGGADNYLRFLFPHEFALRRASAHSENRLCVE